MRPKKTCDYPDCGLVKNAPVHGGDGWEHDFVVGHALNAGQRPRTPLRPRSDRQERVYEQYRPMVKGAVGDGNRPCPVKSPHCTGKVEGLHEILTRGRAGGLGAALRDGPPPIPCCNACNRFISEHPKWAEDAGLLQHAGRAT